MMGNSMTVFITFGGGGSWDWLELSGMTADSANHEVSPMLVNCAEEEMMDGICGLDLG